MSGERLDKGWRQKGLASYSTEAILGTLRHYGVAVEEAQLREVSSRAEALAHGARWSAQWKGTGPFAELPAQAALVLWERLGRRSAEDEAAAKKAAPAVPSSLPRLRKENLGPPELTPEDVKEGTLSGHFWERYRASGLEQQLALARASAQASELELDADMVFELGNELQEGLAKAGRIAEFDALLDAWEAHHPEALNDPFVRAWGAERALRGRGGNVGEALLQLAKARGGDSSQLHTYAEWALYRGHLQEAHAALQAAWPWVRDKEGLFQWAYQRFFVRVALTAFDVALTEDPSLSEEALLARATPAGETLEPDNPWVRQALQLRTGRVAWQPPDAQLPRPSAEELAVLQQGLVMALEPFLRQVHGWPLSRTQLLQPYLLDVMVERPKKVKAKKGEKGKTVEVSPSPSLLLPSPERVAEWAREDSNVSEERYHHPHAHGAVALALLPLGAFLREKGVLDAAQEAEWARKVRAALAPLPAQLEAYPELAADVRRVVG